MVQLLKYIKALNDAVDFSQKPHELKAALLENSDEHKEPKNNVFLQIRQRVKRLLLLN